MKIYEYIPTQDKNHKTRKKRIEIINPTENEKWFYLIHQKDTQALQKMLDNKFNINQIDMQGQTIAHYALFLKSYRLLNFCIEHQASFVIPDIYESIPMDSIFLKNYSWRFFKKIMDGIQLEKLFLDTDPSMVKMRQNINFLAYHDDNLQKIKYICSRTNAFRQHMIEQSIKSKAIENWKYLTGRGELLKRLNQDLFITTECEKIQKI